uniref:Uncharacterized protein n=1 Tax=Panagrolaimus sp. ES5 TaxID=591445 RepID=A0AC34GM72_9BILA
NLLDTIKMSQRVSKTPRRTPSIDPSEKDFISHCRLRDVPTDGTLNGISLTDDPDTVVFIYGSKRDRRNQLIYTSFKEAVNYDTFKKYLYKHLIPCYSRRCGNGFSYIYKGNNDYTILEDDDNERENEEDDESIKADEEVNEII